ncbi:hypothetical protein [Pectinatus sottacetonis]|uniref:hypothetical protein n=1 Tax=Pectinatus sottacetonis TaxID=1002795 RepID=UPI0018C627FE|nr:hypothetical protein [Pectinatus sottacetonis]
MSTSTVVATFYNFATSLSNKGRLRLITSSSTSTPAYTPVSGSGTEFTNTDPIAFYFNGGSGTGIRVLLVERNYDSSYQQTFCTLSVYDPSSWTKTVAENSSAYEYNDGTPLLNIYSINSPGGTDAGTLYGADYTGVNNDNGRIFKLIHDVSGGAETLTLDSHDYQFVPTTSGAKAHSVDSVFNTESGTDYVYAAAQQYSLSGSPSNPANYTYYNSIIVKLDPGTLTPVSGGGPSASLAPNVFDLQYYGGSFYVTALGGAQWNQTSWKWNYTSRIQKVTTGLTVTDLVRPANSTETDSKYDNDKFDIRSLAILEDGTAYIINGSYDSNFAFTGHLWHANIADLTGDDLLYNTATLISNVSISTVNGYLWALLPADELGKVWGMLGDTLGVYDASGISGSAIDAATASGWTDGTPAFNAISLAMPAVTRRGSRAIKSVRGFVHPVLVSRAGMSQDEYDDFISSYAGK